MFGKRLGAVAATIVVVVAVSLLVWDATSDGELPPSSNVESNIEMSSADTNAIQVSELATAKDGAVEPADDSARSLMPLTPLTREALQHTPFYLGLAMTRLDPKLLYFENVDAAEDGLGSAKVNVAAAVHQCMWPNALGAEAGIAGAKEGAYRWAELARISYDTLPTVYALIEECQPVVEDLMARNPDIVLGRVVNETRHRLLAEAAAEGDKLAFLTQYTNRLIDLNTYATYLDTLVDEGNYWAMYIGADLLTARKGDWDANAVRWKYLGCSKDPGCGSSEATRIIEHLLPVEQEDVVAFAADFQSLSDIDYSFHDDANLPTTVSYLNSRPKIAAFVERYLKHNYEKKEAPAKE